MVPDAKSLPLGSAGVLAHTVVGMWASPQLCILGVVLADVRRASIHSATF